MRNMIKLITPPIITQAIKSKKSSATMSLSHNLFDNEPNFFEDEIQNCAVYGEYGTGSSTRFALTHSEADVICVDTDPYWLREATHGFSESSRLYSKSVDVGKVMAWGIPVGAARLKEFKEYTDWIWEQKEVPDLVLIDGRFRVCSFFTTLTKCKPGCRIIFDDYVHRPQYHFVERFLPVHETRGRQAFFVVPEKKNWDKNDLEFAIQAFRCNLN